MTTQNKQKWYSFVPSFFTSMNLVCGVIATYLSFEGKINIALALMIIAALFDFIDGFVARLLKVSGDFGKELDSLADVISFGFVPGAMLFYIQKSHIQDFHLGVELSFLQWIILLSTVLIPVFSSLRLSKFNIVERQKSEFIGLPTPANALFIAALSYTFVYQPEHWLSTLNNPLIIVAVIVVFSFLLVSEIPLFALKFKSFSLKGNAIRYIFIVLACFVLILFKIPGLSLVIVLYIVTSIITKLFKA